MDAAIVDQVAGSQESWRAWVQKGKKHDRATARKMQVSVGIVLVLLAIGSAFYLLAVR